MIVLYYFLALLALLIIKTIYWKKDKKKIQSSKNKLAELDSASRLKKFEDFMNASQTGWILTSKTDGLLSHQKVIPGQRVSILVLILLLFLGVFPGIIYLLIAFSHKPTQVHNLTVSFGNDGSFRGAGDSAGINLYQIFLLKYQS